MLLLFNFIIKNVCFLRSEEEGWNVIVVVSCVEFLELENGLFVKVKLFGLRVDKGINVVDLKLIFCSIGLNDFILYGIDILLFRDYIVTILFLLRLINSKELKF